MAFWEEAVDQAGRDFGHRFRRWFWTARTVKRAAPGLVFVGLVGLVAWGAMWVWDHLSEIGPAAGHAWGWRVDRPALAPPGRWGGRSRGPDSVPHRPR
jgi:hypothetical protein